MRITTKQLRKIIREAINAAQGDDMKGSGAPPPVSFWKEAAQLAQTEPDSHVYWALRSLWHIENDDDWFVEEYAHLYNMETGYDKATDRANKQVTEFLYDLVQYEEERNTQVDKMFDGMTDEIIQSLCMWLVTGWKQLNIGPYELGAWEE